MSIDPDGSEIRGATFIQWGETTPESQLALAREIHRVGMDRTRNELLRAAARRAGEAVEAAVLAGGGREQIVAALDAALLPVGFSALAGFAG